MNEGRRQIRLGWTAGIVCLLLTATAHADKIYFTSGAVWEGVIHEENFYFEDRRNDPNFIEIEMIRSGQVICVGIDLLTMGEQIQRIERDPDFAFPPGVKMHPNLEAAKEAYQEEQERLAREATPTPSADLQLGAEVIFSRGWAFRGDENQQVQLIDGLEIPPDSPLQTRWNSRLKCRIGQALVIGLDQHSQMLFRGAAWNQVERNYRVRLGLDRGVLWLEKAPGTDPVQRIHVDIPPIRIAMGNSLVRVVLQTNSAVKVGVFDGETIEVQAGGDSVTVQQGKEFRLKPQGGGSSMHDLPELNEADRWEAWDNWQPVNISLDLELEMPDAVRAPLKPMDYALPSLGSADRGLAGTEPRAMTLVDILAAYRSGLERFRDDTGSYPDPDAGLRAMRENPGVEGWQGPYVSLNVPPQDVWGSPFVYKLRQLEGGRVLPDIYSPGPNGRDDDRFGDDVY